MYVRKIETVVLSIEEKKILNNAYKLLEDILMVSIEGENLEEYCDKARDYISNILDMSEEK